MEEHLIWLQGRYLDERNVQTNKQAEILSFFKELFVQISSSLLFLSSANKLYPFYWSKMEYCYYFTNCPALYFHFHWSLVRRYIGMISFHNRQRLRITYQKKENDFTLKKARSKRYSTETNTDADYAVDLALLKNTHVQAELQLHSLIQTHIKYSLCLLSKTCHLLIKSQVAEIRRPVHIPR